MRCLKPRRELVVVIGHIGGEVGVAAVRLHERAIDVVAEVGGPEQRLLAILPVAVVVAFGFLQPAQKYQPLPAQLLDGLGHLILVARQRALGEEHVVANVEGRLGPP